MVTTKKFLGLILIILATYSCTVYKKVQLPPQNGIQGYHGTNQTREQQIAQANAKRLEVYQAEKAFIKNSDNLEWGLAMSGGGVRSATYNFGALKALYDLGLLQKMQIISSVSGGSYMSYGLYTNYANNTIKPFGYQSFDNSAFFQETCNMQGLANFITNWKYVKAILSTPKGAFNIYKKQIERAYGHEQLSSFKITSLNPEIKKANAPYFIINSTLAAKKDSDWLNRVVEFTPAHYGNPELGLTTWNSSNTIDWSEATTISAAALKCKLLYKIPYTGTAINSDYLALSDGGHSENLAAIGLIRRGVKNIIIIDAEHNNNYSFDGYLILKHQLQKELNLNISIPSIDAFLIDREVDSKTLLKTAVHKGIVSTIPIKGFKQEALSINIYYVKMAMPQNMLAQRRNQDKVKQGNNTYLNIEEATCTKKINKVKCKEYNCEPLLKMQTPDLKSLALYWVDSYANYLGGNKKWKRLGYTFPHTLTPDQSFYRDQLAAFIGLGYLQALELKEFINK
jgi:hypothetical protein